MMTAAPPVEAPVHERLIERLTKFTRKLDSIDRIHAALDYYTQITTNNRFQLPMHTPTDEAFYDLALTTPAIHHSPALQKLKYTLAELNKAHPTKIVSTSQIPQLLLEAMTLQPHAATLAYHSPRHGAEVARDSAWCVKNWTDYTLFTTAQLDALTSLMFLMGAAHDSIFTRDRGHDEVASALLLTSLLNLHTPAPGELLDHKKAREDLIQIIYYAIVAGTMPLFGPTELTVLANTIDPVSEPPNDGTFALRTPTIPHLAPESPISISLPAKQLLKKLRTPLTFVDVHSTQSSRITASSETPGEYSTATTVKPLMTLFATDASYSAIEATADRLFLTPEAADAALLRVGQGLRTAIESTWITDLAGGITPAHPMAACINAIYQHLLVPHHDSKASITALLTNDQTPLILTWLCDTFRKEKNFAAKHLNNGYAIEFGTSADKGTNSWSIAAELYAALADQAAHASDQSLDEQRQFVCSMMILTSHQRGAALAKTIMSTDFDLHPFLASIGRYTRDGLDSTALTTNIGATETIAEAAVEAALAILPEAASAATIAPSPPVTEVSGIGCFCFLSRRAVPAPTAAHDTHKL